MRLFAVMVFVFLMLGSVYFLWQTQSDRDSSVAVIEQNPSATVNGRNAELHRNAEESEAGSKSGVVNPAQPGGYTHQQEIAALEKEQELLQLAKEYDEVRSDPDKREAHRAEMKEKLAAYSEAVLPIALEKARATQEQ